MTSSGSADGSQCLTTENQVQDKESHESDQVKEGRENAAVVSERVTRNDHLTHTKTRSKRRAVIYNLVQHAPTMKTFNLQVGGEHRAEQIDEKDDQQTLLESESEDCRPERPSRKSENIEVCRNPEEEEIPEPSVVARIRRSRDDSVVHTNERGIHKPYMQLLTHASLLHIG